MSRSSSALRQPILFYQALRAGHPSACRFEPSCSTYALEAIEIHGSLRGSWLAMRRLGRCHPLGPSGIDLVPSTKQGVNR
ncbi:MAG: membrane protein insertion efficiency factor YidD [Actinomycetes bacterium]